MGLAVCASDLNITAASRQQTIILGFISAAHCHDGRSKYFEDCVELGWQSGEFEI